MTNALVYDGIDAHWERQQRQEFAALRHAASDLVFQQFMVGKLLEDDLHVSCKPMLPPSVSAIDRMTLNGSLILQLVDITNIGANFEHRTEDTKGATRTLKLCLTDGHQLVFGFEYRWLPNLSTATARGTKLVVSNVNIRHGMLMLTPQNCHVLGASGNPDLETIGKMMNTLSGAKTKKNAKNAAANEHGAYAAALTTNMPIATNASMPAASTPQFPVTSGLNKLPSAPQVVLPAIQSAPMNRMLNSIQPPAQPPAVANPKWNQQRQMNPPIPTPRQMNAMDMPQRPMQPTKTGIRSNSATPMPSQVSVAPAPAAPATASSTNGKRNTTEPVFLEISSDDDDCDSDATDPAVQHLFYSPNTPRDPTMKNPTTTKPSSPHRPMRKRPRVEPASATSSSSTLPGFQTARDVIQQQDYNQQQPPVVDMTKPLTYFRTRLPILMSSRSAGVVEIRGCIKSVTGFQFNTGVYNLSVLIEDGTETTPVRVDPAFVEQLMGVSCMQFMHTMRTNPPLAHQWAAKMQFSLMTLEGVLRFRHDPQSPSNLALESCRDYTKTEAQQLLARVRAIGSIY